MRPTTALVIWALLSVFAWQLPAQPAPRPPRNVILMIGDGMGLNQIISARYQKGRMALEGFRVMGVSLTHSIHHFVTDSSAGATTLGSGYLIVNGEVGVHPDGRPVKLIVEYAEERGKWTGLVATSRITHATPASMATHVKSRGSEEDIALQLSQSELDVILGGGWDMFLPGKSKRISEELPERPLETASRGDQGPVDESCMDEVRGLGRGFLSFTGAADSLESRVAFTAEAPLLFEGKPYGTRKDGRDLVESMKRRGFRFVRTAGELALATRGAPGKLLGLFHSGPMPKAAEGRSPTLGAMSIAALQILSQGPEGFFLMIEGSQIDWGGHSNDFDYMMNEASDFDTAIGEVLAYLTEAGIAGETLVVVTADHETGGLALHAHPNLPLGFEAKWSTGSHTAAPVPVFATGRGAAAFGGIQTHEDLGRKLIRAVVGGPVEFPYPADSSRPTAGGRTQSF